MPRALAAVVALLAITRPPARAADALAPETVAALKAAAVYIRVESDGWKGSGSGFVVAADKDRVLVVTNHHVALKPPADAPQKPPAVRVVFGSGTRAEREYRAAVVGSDEVRDLAVLRVDGVKDPPKPLAYVDPPKPVETMGVFSFGFPLGQALATGKGAPAVTVGKASVSSLREGEDGELAVIQIDGNLNPGNSGGPVVDAKGRLIGVAVARARDGQGIGFLVPAAEVGRLMAGRVGRVRVAVSKDKDGKPVARIEAEVLDPAGAVRAVAAYCVVVPPKEEAPAAPALDKHPGAKKVELKVDKGLAVGELAIGKAEGAVLVQVIGSRATAEPVSTRPRPFALVPGIRPEDLAGPPPTGWKDHLGWGRGFSVWLPEKPAPKENDRREFALGTRKYPAIGLTGKSEGGLSYRVEMVPLPVAIGRLGADLYPAVRNTLRDETEGRITDATEARSGDWAGAEYRLEKGAAVTRVRVYVRDQRIYMARVSGTAAQVSGADAETILVSFRKPGELRVEAPNRPGIGPAEPKVIAPGKEPFILGSIEHDPKFKTLGPPGAVLIGLEVRFGKFGHTDIARAVRPIYRVDGKEEFGTQFGRDLKGSVTLKAKDGYAVGGITGKAGWWCNGFALTFMKVKPDGTLDPKDSYDSEWVGFDGKSEVFKVSGGGAPVVGIVGKIVGAETTALGLVFKGQEKFAVGAGGAPVDPKVTTAGTEAVVVGGKQHPAFKAAGPAGGVLIGLELSIENAFVDDAINGVRPIHRVTRGGKSEETFGDHFGARERRSVTLKARDGYAVGAITYKYSRDFDGCLLTFMKVKPDGTLDPKDSYDSEWVGWKGRATEGRIDGEGKPVVGIVGRGTAKELTGFGLLFKGQTFDTDARNN